MSNSSLVTYKKLSTKCNERTHTIDKITIHHMAGKMTAKECCDYFCKTDKQVSANYVIGYDGSVGLNVEESKRAWTSSNKENDMRAVTIEVSNDGGEPEWHVSDKALNKLIDLCIDICKRNGIKKLTYDGTKNGNLTIHSMFAATGCPGAYLKSKLNYICDEVNKALTPSAASSIIYRVQVGAYSIKTNAEQMLKKLKSLGIEGFIVEEKKK